MYIIKSKFNRFMDEKYGGAQYMTSGKYYRAEKDQSYYCFTDDSGEEHYISIISTGEDDSEGIFPSEVCQAWDLPTEERQFILMVDPNFFTREEE